MGAVTFPTGRFPTPTGNDVVSLGAVYIGEVNLDPSVEENRIDVSIVQQDGNIVVIPPASQPFVLNSAGIFTYNGSVVQLRTSQNYSMLVLDQSAVEMFYFPSVAGGDVLLGSELLLSAGSTPTPIAGVGQFYTREVNGIVEFFYMDSAGNEIQFTNNGAFNIDLGTSAVQAAVLEALGLNYGGYFRGGVAELVSVDNVTPLDWTEAQYFTMLNTETTVMEFSNVPLIGEGVGQTILIAIQDAGNFAITLSPEAGYTLYVRSIDNPPILTTDGLDLIILTVYASGIIVAVPLFDFVPIGP